MPERLEVKIMAEELQEWFLLHEQDTTVRTVVWAEQMFRTRDNKSMCITTTTVTTQPP